MLEGEHTRSRATQWGNRERARLTSDSYPCGMLFTCMLKNCTCRACSNWSSLGTAGFSAAATAPDPSRAAHFEATSDGPAAASSVSSSSLPSPSVRGVLAANAAGSGGAGEQEHSVWVGGVEEEAGAAVAWLISALAGGRMDRRSDECGSSVLLRGVGWSCVLPLLGVSPLVESASEEKLAQDEKQPTTSDVGPKAGALDRRHTTHRSEGTTTGTHKEQQTGQTGSEVSHLRQRRSPRESAHGLPSPNAWPASHA